MAGAWCVSATGVGMFRQVGIALSGVAGDGVDVGIRNAEAEVLRKSRTIDRSILGNAVWCCTGQRVLPGICRHVTAQLLDVGSCSGLVGRWSVW